MPDSIVPIVRRPVRRVSTTPATEPKLGELSSAARKLSIGGESNNDRVSPPRLTRSFLPSSSPTEERRRQMVSDGTPVEEPKEIAKEVIKDTKAISGFPSASKDNLPALPVSRNRPIKTSVSVFEYINVLITKLRLNPF